MTKFNDKYFSDKIFNLSENYYKELARLDSSKLENYRDEMKKRQSKEGILAHGKPFDISFILLFAFTHDFLLEENPSGIETFVKKMIVCVCPKGHTQTVLLLKLLYLSVYILYVLFAFYCSCRVTED